ncbi:MAG TPA: LptA/OstA family protein [Stellaceae bacterium]|nr:LptA/OstA family protein [Stellaceae bacterium]
MVRRSFSLPGWLPGWHPGWLPGRLRGRLRGPLAALGAAIVVLCGISPGGAATQALAPSGSLPIQIQADSGIEWQQNAHLYIARGNAVAIRGPSEVHADVLIGHYRDVKGGSSNTGGTTGGNTEIYRIEAEGHVVIKRGDQTVVGDNAVYDVDKAVAVVTGKGLKLTTPTDTVTARDSLEWYEQKQIAVARGDAVATRNGKTIKANILTAYMVKTAPSRGQLASKAARPGAARGKPAVNRAGVPGDAAADAKISRIDAQGHVIITNGIDTGHGDFGVYNEETGLATLIGNVVIERAKDVIRGQRAVMDLNRNISRVLPGGAPGMAHQRVQGLLVREKQGEPLGLPGVAPGRSGAPAGGKKP